MLTRYTKGKTTKELVSQVEKAKSEELAKQAAWELEKAKEAKLVEPLRETRPAQKGERPAVQAIQQNDRRFARRKATLRAEAAYHAARVKRELAEIAVEEYVEVGFPQELATIEAELKRAQTSLEPAKKEAEWARKIVDRGYLLLIPTRGPELVLEMAEFQIEQAKSRRKVLVEYTKPKMLKELREAVENTRADEQRKKSLWEHEKAKESDQERRIVRPGSNLHPTRA